MRNLDNTKLGQVRCQELNFEQHETALAQAIDQFGQRDF